MAATTFIANPRGIENFEIKRALPAIFTEQPHPSRSDKYLYVPTEHAINMLRDRGYVPVEAQVSRTRTPDNKMFVKHMLWFVERQYTGRHVLNDEWPRLGIVNSYGGQSAWEVMLGFFRMICANGMIVSTGKVDALRVAHKTNNTLEALWAATDQIAVRAQDKMVSVQEWKQIVLDRPEQELFARHAAHARFGDAAVVEGTLAYDPQEILRERRREDHGDDLYRVFGRAEENLHNGFVHNQRSGRKARTINGIDGKVAFEQGMWNLAEEFAALKRGQ